MRPNMRLSLNTKYIASTSYLLLTDFIKYAKYIIIRSQYLHVIQSRKGTSRYVLVNTFLHREGLTQCHATLVDIVYGQFGFWNKVCDVERENGIFHAKGKKSLFKRLNQIKIFTSMAWRGWKNSNSLTMFSIHHNNIEIEFCRHET